MNILIICYCYPPDPGPRAYRWSAIAEYWAAPGNGGHTVHVISAAKQGALAEERLNGVHVHRVGGAFSENIRLWLERRRNKAPGTSAVVDTSAPGGAPLTGLGRILKIIHDITWKKVYWPDSACTWFFPARAMARRLCSDIAFDGVISTSTPYTGNLVGKAVKESHPDLPWIVDIGDPFSFGKPPWNNITLYQGLNHRSEASILKQADAVSVTVESCKQAYEDLFPDLDGKVSVIPPLFSGEIANRDDTHRNAADTSRKRSVVFTGSLYRDIRNPAYLLKLLAGVFAKDSDVQAHFYGRLNDCTSLFDEPLAQFPDNLFVHGLVTRDAAAAALGQADVLVNIANTTRHQLPSKLADYMASGKPIVNIVSIEDDNSVSFLKDYPQTATFIEHSSSAAGGDVQRLSDFISDSQMVTEATVTKLLRPFGVPTIEAQYRAFFMIKGRQ